MRLFACPTLLVGLGSPGVPVLPVAQHMCKALPCSALQINDTIHILGRGATATTEKKARLLL